jgi:hypothetical protein
MALDDSAFPMFWPVPIQYASYAGQADNRITHDERRYKIYNLGEGHCRIASSVCIALIIMRFHWPIVSFFMEAS